MREPASRGDSSSASLRRRAWLAATRRRNEMIRLGKHRAAYGGKVDESRFLFVLAQTLASAEPGRYRVKLRVVTWHGLNRITLAVAAARAGIGPLGGNDPLLDRAMDGIEASKAMGSDVAGQLLDLTAEERDLLSIRTIEAVDEPRAERECRRIEERRARDAARKREARAGRVSRAEYLATSLTATKPWEAMGLTRATYYRKRSTIETGMSAATYEQGEKAIAVAASRETGMSAVRQVCPRTHVRSTYRDGADIPVSSAAAALRLQRSNSSLCPSDGASVASRHEGLTEGEQTSLSEKILPASAAEPNDPSEPLQDADLHRHVQIALGRGDIDLGRRLARVLGRKKLDWLKERVAADGIVGAADELGRAADRALEIMKSRKPGGAANVVA